MKMNIRNTVEWEMAGTGSGSFLLQVELSCSIKKVLLV
jgi:hypothetical protein